MPRFNRRRPEPFFRSSELLRLASMVVMFCVVFMMMSRARDASTWRWLVNDDSQPSHGGPADPANLTDPPDPSDQSSTAVAAAAPDNHNAAGAAAPAAPRPAAAGPTDQDPQERVVAQWEFQAIGDKAPLQREEMLSYWRLMAWVQRQTSAELARRSRKDVLFTHMFETPEKYRGQPVRLKLHLMRSLRHEAGENKLGLTWMYEVWGWTNDSQPWPYVVVFPEWPKGMPLGSDIREEATVDAYFLKLMAYRAHDDKVRVAPLLIGRLNWHPSPLRDQGQEEWFWAIALSGGVVLIAAVGVWVFRFVLGSSTLAGTADAPSAKVDNWLEKLERGEESGPELIAEDFAVDPVERDFDNGLAERHDRTG